MSTRIETALADLIAVKYEPEDPATGEDQHVDLTTDGLTLRIEGDPVALVARILQAVGLDAYLEVEDGTVRTSLGLPIFDLDNIRDGIGYDDEDLFTLLSQAIAVSAIRAQQELSRALRERGYDTESSASVQHYIDTGVYLRRAR